ncbi:MAG: hypothetical protein TEF_06760 [Rhizobiales bacterium NRL2]|jgi:apolipoprotein N-acyltransferase|nr:MAG: hypothetical protein TEF_06760 [Rhizobiales bacterium NRL2]
MALAIGFVLVALVGAAHNYGLLLIRWITPGVDSRPQAAIIGVFTGLLALHSAEILAFAGAYHLLLQMDWIGSLAANPGETWRGLIYFSGINFVTLGYTQIDAYGPIRMVAMMQSLGGFMLLTWSATFLYTVCHRAWED